jgi:hypothetical protein
MERVKNLISKHFYGCFVTLVSAFALVSCGIPVGGGKPNDPAPNGTIVASGNLTGSKASANVSIYVVGATYILRLDSVSAPSENGLQVYVNLATGPGRALQASLRASTGNQNYTIPTPGMYSTVQIYSTAAQTVYGQASLIYPTP